MTEPTESDRGSNGRHAGPPAQDAPSPSTHDVTMPVRAHAAPVVPAPGSSVVPTRRPGKLRSPIGGWLLALVTFGIYFLFWYYNVNKELRDFDSSINVRPGLAVLSLFVPIVNLVSIYNTGGRIRQAQSVAGAAPMASGVIGLLLAFVIGLDLPYYNSQANHAWRAAGAI